ncbi:MAG: hypothetical protein IPJ12_14705 [Betaproteobacteria bacterium]|nr:hypothetical protein [Betaproteobacteria bacterium]
MAGHQRERCSGRRRAGSGRCQVELKDNNGVVVQSMTTDANGNYGFTVAPGTYSVSVVAPPATSSPVRTSAA